ncbi:DUF2264 domain-containing protein [Agrobacterium rhizogenes]|uniref:DUF2264 domain-containing protein n=1 Tax=Rhizobium rhizogenes TaxID=359 RepID=UPI001571ECE5|nr:DUF2264 domain-containing protein [Rhizobium rhizogenes]MDJ1638281.1 DUF2264 domain-containing protein [Rhizobium rhizogenes]NTF50206.1 DUF2264 domain-containing protein [Rhizobium rhizogenes]NTF56834.1 DUF2264 domain-containing protein [Rhizobium rhizogenes]NTF76416.1 DUF2264 domain-containing protein [Rhizobium rhizogenes]NTG29151.1 DUF2264 domain-containing protein [Rhizobium rhizogenes]
MIYDPVSTNPLAGNPLKNRSDMRCALTDLFDPLLPYFSKGNARVRIDAAGAHFDRAAADLEGFARPLWGLAPLGAGGGDFAHWDRYAKGIANGVDPSHPEYWGGVNGRDQRMVELAALGFALALVPEKIWEPLDARARGNLIAYLKHARTFDYADNNWRFFRVLVDIALDRLGATFDRSLTEDYLRELDSFYIADGWYRDGNIRRIDHYVPFAMHFYGLIYSKLVNDDRAERYRERAALFAKDFRHWFAPDGATIPFGRSLTYRFACAGFWSALAFADVEALPWGEIKGLCLRHLRWWADKPIANRDGTLPIGYAYPNLLMSENYNSAGSPYWAFKAFLPLALPETHPFWTAEEKPQAAEPSIVPLKHPGMVMMRSNADVVALSSGQENQQMRFGAEKYAKFAYSARYGFSIESDERAFTGAAFDSMLAFSDDGLHYRVRETNQEAKLAGDTLYAKWSPLPEVTVETWLIPAAPWHIRLHKIVAPRPLQTAEGGFAIARRDFEADTLSAGKGAAYAIGEEDFSGIVDLGSTIARDGVAQKAPPNTNLIASKTLVPQLRGTIPAGETILVSAVLAEHDPSAISGAWTKPPAKPDIDALRALIAEKGVTVSAIEAPGRLP